jgi:hypothetical protein
VIAAAYTRWRVSSRWASRPLSLSSLPVIVLTFLPLSLTDVNDSVQ